MPLSADHRVQAATYFQGLQDRIAPPGNADALHGKALLSMTFGRWDDALAGTIHER